MEFSDLDFGSTFTSTFNAALDREEDAMIAAPFVGVATGLTMPIMAAAFVIKKSLDAAEHCINGLTAGTPQEQLHFDQALYGDMQTLGTFLNKPLEPIGQGADHIAAVAAKNDGADQGSGFFKQETYKQIFQDAGQSATALSAELAALPPSKQIEIALNINSSLLMGSLFQKSVDNISQELPSAAGALGATVQNGSDKLSSSSARQTVKPESTLVTTNGVTPDVRPGLEQSAESAESGLLKMAGKVSEVADRGFSKNLEALREAERIREFAPVTIPHGRNVSYARAFINGENENLVAVSGEKEIEGMVGMPEEHQFGYSNLGDRRRDSHSELKILEDIAALYPRSATGELYLFTENVPCDLCCEIIDKFKKAYLGLKLVGEYAWD